MMNEKRIINTLYAAGFVKGLNDTILFFFGSLYLFKSLDEKSFLWLSVLRIASGLTVFLGANIIAPVVDHYSKVKLAIQIGLLSYAVLFPLLIIIDNSHWFIILAISASLLFSIVEPGTYSYGTILSEEYKGKIIGNLVSYLSYGWFIGGVLLYVLYNYFDQIGMKILFGILFLLASIVLYFVTKNLPELKVKHRNTDLMPSKLIIAWVQEFKELYSNKTIQIIFWILFLCSGGNAVLSNLFMIYMTEYQKIDMLYPTLSVTLSTLIGALISPWFGRIVDKKGRKGTFIASVVAYFLCYLLILVCGNPYLVCFFWMIPVYVGLRVSASAILADISLQEQRTGGMSVVFGSFSLSSAVGGLISGLIADNWNIDYIIPASFLIISCAMVYALYNYRDKLKLMIVSNT